jgi:alkaline phosphatase D
VRTFPPEGQPANFAFAFGSCARTGSQHTVFNTIASKRPAVFIHLGDLHYVNVCRDNPRHFRAAWDTVLSSNTQGALYRNIPLAYIYDDHDFGPNDSDKRNPGRPASRIVYREYMPHYPLPAGDGDAAIHQAFTVARVRFILTDLRSERDAGKTPDGPSKSMMGAAQKEWFKRELLESSRSHGLVVWGSSVPWIGTKSNDSWQDYMDERRELCNFIAQHRIKNLCILCGDAHMLAADDGSHSDYSDSQKLRIPVLHGSAFDQGGSTKGGPFSEGTYLPKSNEGLFGWVEVEDDGQRVAVRFTGRNQDDEVKVDLNFVVA